jgi:hypothetical protein
MRDLNGFSWRAMILLVADVPVSTAAESGLCKTVDVGVDQGDSYDRSI